MGWILDGSWIGFWCILGPSWEVSWGQVGTEIRENGIPRRCQKIIEHLEPQESHKGPATRRYPAPKNISNPGTPRVPGTLQCIRDTPTRAYGPGADLDFSLNLFSYFYLWQAYFGSDC